jgi:EpsI family protein
MRDQANAAKGVFVFCLMMASAIAVIWLRPAPVANQHKAIGLEQIIPKQLSGWTFIENGNLVAPSPEQEALIEKIYDETLARTYINESGEQIMLSIAYGGDQSGRLKVHRPESCYAGQGFKVSNTTEGQLQTSYGQIPVKHLIAQSNGRYEPVTYWIRIGDSTVTNVIGQCLTQFMYSLTGEIPDGLIFRVSSIGENEEVSYRRQAKFINDLLVALSPAQRHILLGKIAESK